VVVTVPADRAVESVEVAAPRTSVLEVLRDVEREPEWIPEILEAELLEVQDDGLPRTARFKASAAVGTDEYTLTYQHHADGISWSMVQGRLQTGQEGRFTVSPLGRNRTSVTYDLTIHHNLPLPGFIRRRVIKGLVDGTLAGLKEYAEA
jgi:uncharacterized membrane protein